MKNLENVTLVSKSQQLVQSKYPHVGKSGQEAKFVDHVDSCAATNRNKNRYQGGIPNQNKEKAAISEFVLLNNL
eukprot:6713094-Ditylum_brightwellii.AAC.1